MVHLSVLHRIYTTVTVRDLRFCSRWCLHQVRLSVPLPLVIYTAITLRDGVLVTADIFIKYIFQCSYPLALNTAITFIRDRLVV